MTDDDTLATDALIVVLTLADCDPIAHDTARGQGMRCVLCDAEPRGISSVLPETSHDSACPWRQASELVREMGRA